MAPQVVFAASGATRGRIAVRTELVNMRTGDGLRVALWLSAIHGLRCPLRTIRISHLCRAIVILGLLNLVRGAFVRVWVLRMVTPEARAAARNSRKRRADARAIALAPVIADIRAGGITGKTAIADELIRRGIRTAYGHRLWRGTQVDGVLKRLKQLKWRGVRAVP
jgi:hypothetical protein